jgi:hypothetical protein
MEAAVTLKVKQDEFRFIMDLLEAVQRAAGVHMEDVAAASLIGQLAAAEGQIKERSKALDFDHQDRPWLDELGDLLKEAHDVVESLDLNNKSIDDAWEHTANLLTREETMFREVFYKIRRAYLAAGRPTARGDSFMWTVSGTSFHPLNPKASEVNLSDVAHALSNICRFGGHAPVFYCVAQHAVLASQLVEELGGSTEEAYAALHHDDAEAYLGDMIRPLKHHLPEYREAEKAVEAVIAQRFDVRVPFDAPIVKRADNVMLATEAVRICRADISTWSLHVLPLDRPIVPWSSTFAKEAFLGRDRELEIRRRFERTEGVKFVRTEPPTLDEPSPEDTKEEARARAEWHEEIAAEERRIMTASRG